MSRASLPQQIRQALKSVADPGRAPAMQAYMKSTMPFLGVTSVPRGAAFREERYAALSLTGAKAAGPFHHIDALAMYEEMVVTGAWWDYVDEIAGHRLWAILQNDRPAMREAMLEWSTDANIWKRRCSILCQLHARRDTDLDLLYACIAPSIDSTEFFLRKAIGWALRQYAWTDPEEVARYVAANAARLSGLSKREALKNGGRTRRQAG